MLMGKTSLKNNSFKVPRKALLSRAEFQNPNSFNNRMDVLARPSNLEEILRLRERFREEMNGQIVHDSIHRRSGWTQEYLLTHQGATAGYGSVAVAGPWKGKPT